jgi:hypothetical protein
LSIIAFAIAVSIAVVGRAEPIFLQRLNAGPNVIERGVRLRPRFRRNVHRHR